jgi:hypothetical protein
MSGPDLKGAHSQKPSENHAFWRNKSLRSIFLVPLPNPSGVWRDIYPRQPLSLNTSPGEIAGVVTFSGLPQLFDKTSMYSGRIVRIEVNSSFKEKYRAVICQTPCITCASAFHTFSFGRNSPENLVEHDLDVVACVPVAVVIKAAGLFEHARHLDATRADEFDIGLGRGVAVLKGAPFLRLPPEDFVIAVGVKRGVDVDQINAAFRQFLELLKLSPHR